MERKRLLSLFLATGIYFYLAPVVVAQRGMGDHSGVVRQGIKPEMANFRGKVMRVITGPCEKGTGKADIGTHFMLKTTQGQEKNIHLGPARQVQKVTNMLSEGVPVSVQVFRTEKMPQGHYNAITVRRDNLTMRLRDQNMRPIWAGQSFTSPNPSPLEGLIDIEHDAAPRYSRSDLYGHRRCFANRMKCGRGHRRGKHCRR